MTWCDKLASTPSAGLKFDKVHFPSATYLDKVRPLLASMSNETEDRFSVNKLEAFALEISGGDGYQYGIDHSRVFVDFKHHLKVKPQSGAVPTVEMLSKPEPYSKLLENTCAKVLELAEMVYELRIRKLERVGIISTTIVAEEDAPPGIQRFLDHISAPWKGSLQQYNFQLISEIGKTEHYSDRCIHSLSKPENGSGLATYSLDWQRTFLHPKAEDRLKRYLDEAKAAATEYFEELGEGYRFDANRI